MIVTLHDCWSDERADELYRDYGGFDGETKDKQAVRVVGVERTLAKWGETVRGGVRRFYTLQLTLDGTRLGVVHYGTQGVIEGGGDAAAAIRGSVAFAATTDASAEHKRTATQLIADYYYRLLAGGAWRTLRRASLRVGDQVQIADDYAVEALRGQRGTVNWLYSGSPREKTKGWASVEYDPPHDTNRCVKMVEPEFLRCVGAEPTDKELRYLAAQAALNVRFEDFASRLPCVGELWDRYTLSMAGRGYGEVVWKEGQQA